MKLEEMQKIWDSENNQTLYVMNEIAVEKFVKNKTYSANKRVNFVENFIIFINLLVPIVLLIITQLKDKQHFGEYAIAAFTLSVALYTYMYKMKRIKNQENWDKSMLASLDQAIYNATKQAKMTNIFLTWYTLILGILTVTNLVIEKTNIWLVAMIAFLFILGIVVGRWEQRAIHNKQLEDLIALREKLLSEND